MASACDLIMYCIFVFTQVAPLCNSSYRNKIEGLDRKQLHIVYAKWITGIKMCPKLAYFVYSVQTLIFVS